jgi:hypothetical protein
MDGRVFQQPRFLGSKSTNWGSIEDIQMYKWKMTISSFSSLRRFDSNKSPTIRIITTLLFLVFFVLILLEFICQQINE